MLRYQCEYAKSYSGEAFGARMKCKQFVSRELRNRELKGGAVGPERRRHHDLDRRREYGERNLHLRDGFERVEDRNNEQGHHHLVEEVPPELLLEAPDKEVQGL